MVTTGALGPPGPSVAPPLTVPPYAPGFGAGGGTGDGVNRARGEAAKKHSLPVYVGGTARGLRALAAARDLRGPGDVNRPKPQHY